MFRNILLAVTLFFVAACSGEQAVQPATAEASKSPNVSAAASHDVKVAQYNLLFFMDPNGGPCRMQDGILAGMSAELQGKVNIRYVKTTNKNDLQFFYKYGIRGLPSMLFTDQAGNEVKRLPPGIRDAAAIRALVNQLTTG